MGRTDLDYLSRLMAEQVRVATAGAGWLASYFVIYVGGYSFLDIFTSDADGLYLGFGVVTWTLGYVLLLGLMRRGGHLQGGTRSGIGTYLLLSLLIGVGIAIGTILLLLPGYYLAMRWQAAFPRALASGLGAGEAIEYSWTKTSLVQKELAISFFPPVFAYILSLAVLIAPGYVMDNPSDQDYVALMVVANVVLAMALSWFTVLSVSIYGLSTDEGEALTEVFE